jgi:hypothetical protein
MEGGRGKGKGARSLKKTIAVPTKLVEEEDQESAPGRLQKLAAILLLAVVAFVSIDGIFNGWGTVRSILTLNTLELRDKNNLSWQLISRLDFQLIKIKNIQNVLIADSLRNIDTAYRDAGYYRLYFRTSDSLSPKLQKMYEALLSVDTGQTIKRTITDAERAYGNLKNILHVGQPIPHDNTGRGLSDTSNRLLKNDLTLGSGDEAYVVLKRIASNPEILVGLGLGIAASAGIDLLKGGAFLAIAKNDAFRIDSLTVGAHAGRWQDSPIDILWVFAKQDTAIKRIERVGKISRLGIEK